MIAADPLHSCTIGHSVGSCGPVRLPALYRGMTLRDTNQDANDQRAIQLARGARAGTIPEQQARWYIAAMLRDSDIPSVAAGKVLSGWTRQSQDDAAELITDIISAKVAGSTPALDITRIADGASVSGWARQFAVSVPMAQTIRRSMYRRPRPMASDLLDRSGVLGPAPDVAGDTSDHYDEMASRYDSMSHGLPTTDQVEVRARVLAEAYHVPLPGRGVDRRNAAALRMRLYGSGSAVKEDIVETLEDVTAGPRGLTVLWADEPEMSLHTLIELPTLALQALAEHSLTPIPIPAQAHVKALADWVTDTTGVYRRTATRLVNIFVAAHSELDRRSRDTSTGALPQLRPKKSRQADQARWRISATAWITRWGPALGSTPEAVQDRLVEALWAIRAGSPLPSNIG